MSFLKKLFGIARELPASEIDLEIDDKAVCTLRAGASFYKINGLPADEFPRLAEPTGEPVTLDSAELSAALSQVVRAASSDDARPILTGVLLAAEAGGVRGEAVVERRRGAGGHRAPHEREP